jgi:phage terminase large subunit-like protein
MDRTAAQIAAARDAQVVAIGKGQSLIDAMAREDAGEGAAFHPISPLVGEMSPEATEGGGGLVEQESGDVPPSALPGISPTRGEIDSSISLLPSHDGRNEQPDDEVDLYDFQPGHGRDWDLSGRRDQKPPDGDWRTWLLMGGRGSGKTRAGAEWVQALASAGARSDLRIALVAETLGEAREVMVDGVSGICRIARKNRPDFEISRRRLVWSNGAIAQIFSSEDPESLRGPQFHYAWCDELAKWKHAEETFDMLQFGLRLGQDPRQLVTTTPRPVPLLKRLLSDADTRLVRMETRGNAQNLAPGFIAALEKRYGGTRLGRQEVDGELIEDREDALWKRDEIEDCRLRVSDALRRIVVAVDPPSGSGETSCCGIVVAGLDAGGRAVVLADCSVEGMSPAGWAHAVTNAYRRFAADRIVAEVNQGGEMVAAMLRSVDAALPLTLVRATRGKYLRAEPVAALYEQRRVVHAGRFVALEDQMCDFGPEGLSSGRSPDRLDALVWALTALLIDGQGEPRIRGI